MLAVKLFPAMKATLRYVNSSNHISLFISIFNVGKITLDGNPIWNKFDLTWLNLRSLLATKFILIFNVNCKWCIKLDNKRRSSAKNMQPHYKLSMTQPKSNHCCANP